MRFVIERNILDTAMSSIARHAKGNTIPILSNVLISADMAGSVVLTTHNLDACAAATVAADVSAAGAITVSAETLGKLAGGLPKGCHITCELVGTALKV